MIKEFLQIRKEMKNFHEWQNSPLGRTLAVHTNEYFKKNPRLSVFSVEGKNKIVTDFYQQIFNFAQVENPFLAMRESLASYVIGYAGFKVLSLTEEDKSDSFFSDCPYISGELYKHIDKVTDYNDTLSELKWKHPNISKEELMSFCITRCVVYLYYINGINYVRGEFDDIDSDKDWLHPFVKSMLICEENQARGKLGLPSLLPDSLDALRHSTFLNLVTAGCKNPFFEWEKNG
jgi:hypothetical protein